MRVKFDDLIKGLKYIEAVYNPIHTVSIEIDEKEKIMYIEYKDHEIVIHNPNKDGAKLPEVKTKKVLK